MKIPVKTVEEMILEIAGKEAVPVYRTLRGKENVNEFTIAGKVKLTINQIRNIIYKFEQHNLVSSTRKKDRKKGWYIYFFTFNDRHADYVVIDIMTSKINILEKQLEREKGHQFYTCPNKCVRLTIENAMENQFLCHECGSLLAADNNDKTISKINKKIEELKSSIEKLKK